MVTLIRNIVAHFHFVSWQSVTIGKNMRQNRQTKYVFNKTPTIMLEFIFIPVIFGIVTLGVYKIVELFVRKKERLMMIEKLGDLEEGSGLLQRFTLTQSPRKSYSGLKAACLLIGLGVGLLVGFLISSNWPADIPFESRMAYQVRETVNIIYGASVLLSGGLGLLLSFFLEQKFIKKEKNDQGI